MDGDKYKATLLWNCVVRAFCEEMKTSRHWHRLKCFDDTFTGQDAVSWVYAFLSRRREHVNGAEVSRKSACGLLKQFYERGIFKEVDGMVPGFRDSSDALFRFACDPSMIAETPLVLKDTDYVRRFKERMQASPFAPGTQRERAPLAAFDDTVTGRPRVIESGGRGLRVSRSGCFAERLRTPLLTGVKRLERSPSVPELAYRGEVRPPVRRRQLSSCDSSTLLTSTAAELAKVKDELWVNHVVNRFRELLLPEVENLDLSGLEFTDVHYNATHFTKNGICRVRAANDDLPLHIINAFKTLNNWPYSIRDWNNSVVKPGLVVDIFNTVVRHFRQAETPLIPTPFRRLFHAIANKWEKNCENFLKASGSTPNVSPIGGIPRRARSRLPVGPLSEVGNEMPVVDEEYLTELLPYGDRGRSPQEMLDSLPGLRRSPQLMEQLAAMPTPRHRPPPLALFRPGTSATGLRMDSPFVNAVTEGKVTSTPDVRKFLEVPGQRYSVAVAALHESEGCLDRSLRSNRYQGLPPQMTESLQLALLLLPTQNRRKLQLVVRMMFKLINNLAAHLDGDSGENNSKIVLDAFKPLILPECSWLLRPLVYRHETVFAIPFAIGSVVDEEFKQILENQLTQAAPGVQLTPEVEALAVLPQSNEDEMNRQLMDVLEAFVNDENLSQKEKKKRLLNFKTCHAEVFEKRFPRQVDFERLFPDKPKARSRFSFLHK